MFDHLKNFDANGLDAMDLDELQQPWESVYTAETYGQSLDIDAGVRSIIPVHYCRDVTGIKSMTDAIGRLPTATEAMHLWIGGQHSMGHVVPAVLDLAGDAVIDQLHVATLTFSRDNATEWAALIDSGKIKKLTVFCSHYFSKTSPQIYGHGEAVLVPRGVELLARRIHAKLAAIKLSDGRMITAEGSANTRSCRTIEQVTLFGSPEVYTFHVAQMALAAKTTKDRNIGKGN